MLIKITKEHIESGVPQDPRQCPIACALNEYYGDTLRLVYVETHTVEAYFGDLLFQGDLPVAAQRFVEKFDDLNSPVGPFEFELDWKVAV